LPSTPWGWKTFVFAEEDHDRHRWIRITRPTDQLHIVYGIRKATPAEQFRTLKEYVGDPLEVRERIVRRGEIMGPVEAWNRAKARRAKARRGP
jgi:hypothetical protein